MTASIGSDRGASVARTGIATRQLMLIGGVVVALAVSVLVIYPLAQVIFRLFYSGGKWNLSAFADTWTQSGLGTLFTNTLIVVVGSGALAICIATVLAWINERTDAGLGALGDLLPTIPLVIPPIAAAVGWVFLTDPTIGFLNVWIRDLLGRLGINVSSGPFNVFTMPGMILPYAFYLVPFAYFQIANSLRNIDPALEQASRVSGAGRWRTFRRITVRAIAPSIASAAVLVLIMSTALYAIPAVIGTRAEIEVLATRIVSLLTASFPPMTGPAVVLSLAIVIVVGGASIIQGRLNRATRSSQITGRALQPVRASVGKWKWPIRIVVMLFLVVTVLLPFFATVIVSLQAFWLPTIKFSALSLSSYRAMFATGSEAGTGLLNSSWLGLASATILTAIGVILSLLARNAKSGRISQWISSITSLPGSISHIVVAVGFILAFAGPPFNLANTTTILLLCYITIYLPQAYFSSTAAIGQVGGELLDASHTSGAGGLRSFRRVVLPLSFRGILGGWMLAFVLVFGELTASVMLAGPRSTVIGAVIIDQYNNGTYPVVAALCTIVTVLSGVVLTIVTLVTRGRTAVRH